MDTMLTTLQENAKKILNSLLDLMNTAAEAVVNVAGQGAKTGLEKVKKFVDENRQTVMMVAGAVAGLIVLCTVLKLLFRKKRK